MAEVMIMPVFLVTHVATNGNKVSRPVAAPDRETAITEREMELGLPDPDVKLDDCVVMNDPEGTMEMRLLEAERRARENDFFRQPPAPKSRARRIRGRKI